MLNAKLKGLPHIYYLNLDAEVNRRKYMESQFSYWGIENYTRASASKFLVQNFEQWKHVLHLPEYHTSQFNFWDKNSPSNCRNVAVSISHLEIIKEWVEETTDPYMIIMEDDTDINLIKYWHFDWEYLMNNIPYDWDAIQLMFNSDSIIPCFLHVKLGNSWNGPIMITRFYAEKLLRLYFINGKYNFLVKSNRKDLCFVTKSVAHVGVDDFLGFNGKVYQLPLFSQNPYLDKTQRKQHIISHRAHYFWWKKMRDKFTLDDFFTYGKNHDIKMTINIKPWI